MTNKDNIQNAVAGHTGRDLQINGELELSLFPWLGLEVNKLSLGNAKGFQAPRMAEFQKALFKVKLLPLLKKNIHVGTLQLKDFQINLARDQQGETNWQDLIPTEKKAPGDTKPPSGKPGARPLEPAGLTIERIEFLQGELSWQDAASQTIVFSISNLRFSIFKTKNMNWLSGINPKTFS